MSDLAASYEVTRRSGSSFRYSFLFLARPKRDALTAVYAFCREIDDIADDSARPAEEKADRLAHWREQIGRCYAGAAPSEPLARALVPAIARYSLPRRHFEAILEGCQMDLAPRRYRSFGELEGYCYRVAAAVGLLCIEIFGYRDPGVRRYALALATALQLTNILRDVGSDLERGRLYLPTEDLARFGVSEAELARGLCNPAVCALLRYQGERAEGFYAQAQALLPPAERRRMLPARIMGEVYHALLGAIEQAGYDVFAKKIRVSKWRQLSIALRLGAGALFEQTARPHDGRPAS